MIRKIKQKIDSLIGSASGYKGIIFINLSILLLVLGLMFVQYNWISKEKKTLKSMIEKQGREKKVRKNRLQKPSKRVAKEKVIKKKQFGVSNGPSNGRGITKSNIANRIKKADMFFNYEQFEKAAIAYERVINSRVAIDKSDRIYSRLADSHYKLKRYEKAIALYKKVSNDYLNSPYRLSAQLGLGDCLIVTGDYDGARRVLYEVAGQEARYTDDKDKDMVTEAHYKIAGSYIEQAKHYIKKDGARHNTVVVR